MKKGMGRLATTHLLPGNDRNQISGALLTESTLA